MEDTIVLYPSPGIGHLVSMVEFGNLILKHHPSFSIIVIIYTVPFATGSTAPYIDAVSATTPSITFHHLPTISPPLKPSSPSDIPVLSFEIPRLNNPNLHKTLLSISDSSKHIKAFIIDFFCSAAMEVSKQLSIPTYYFFISGGYALAFFLHIPTIDKKTTKSVKDLNTKMDDIPSFPPLGSSDMPNSMLDRTLKIYELFLQTAETMQHSSGIIVNTFEGFEEKAINTIRKGLSVPDGCTPPVYCIGPLISTKDDEKHECLSWLDSQPSQSVLFLSFGSVGLFSEEQLKEIANGLERSGVRFLWVVRSPPSGDGTGRKLANGGPPPPSLELDSFLPLGFLGRTKDRGYVVRDWAPQMAVLSHDSVGGFMTHCGWNSVLESVCAGVPMLAWPLYAEQNLNRVILVEEKKVALKVNQLEDGFVTATELEERVKELMDSKEGKAVRDRVTTFRDGAMVAVSDGGSSRVDLAKLIELLKKS